MMSNNHIMKDENLGGVLREFVEVDRKAKDGDFAVFKIEHKGITPGKPYEITVTKQHGGMIEFYDDSGEEHWWDIPSEEFTIVEPTDIVYIDGERYRMIDRKAKVGEKVIVVKACFNGESYKNGDIFVVSKVRQNGIFANVDSEEYITLFHSEYRVLEPAQELITATEGDNKSIIDLLTNIAQRLTSLERKLERLESATEQNARNIETWAEDIERLKHDENIVLNPSTFAKLLAEVKR